MSNPMNSVNKLISMQTEDIRNERDVLLAEVRRLASTNENLHTNYQAMIAKQRAQIKKQLSLLDDCAAYIGGSTNDNPIFRVRATLKASV